MNVIRAKDFDVSKFSIPTINTRNEHGTMYTQYPQYNYSGDTKSNCIFLTEKITFGSGSKIPSIHQDFRPTDKECMYLYITNSKKTEGSEELFLVLENIDDLFNDVNFVKIEKTDKTVSPLAKLRYFPIVKTFDEDENEFKYDKRIKVRFNTVYDPTAKATDPKKITTKVFLPVDMNKPYDDIVFKSKPEHVETLDDLRKLIPFGSTVQMTIQISKYWAMKNLTSGQRNSGLILKCLQIFVYNNKIQNKRFAFDVIPPGLGIKIQGQPDVITDNKKNTHIDKYDEVKGPKKVVKKDCSDEDSDEDSDEECNNSHSTMDIYRKKK